MTRIGVVATNQERKDWGLVAEVCAKLTQVVEGDVSFWWHIDALKRAWDITALVEDFGLSEVVEVTLAPMDEQELVRRYRECNVTLAPGSEGFGYPIFESLACGVPVVHGAYAAGASLMASCGLAYLCVPPVAWRFEGQFNARRPVYDSDDWVKWTLKALEITQVTTPEEWRARVQHLDWPNLGPRFLKWFDDGLGVVQI